MVITMHFSGRVRPSVRHVRKLEMHGDHHAFQKERSPALAPGLLIHAWAALMALRMPATPNDAANPTRAWLRSPDTATR